MSHLIISKAYFEKQRSFRSLVKEIQTSLNTKEYKQHGCSLNDYIKMRWNISNAQAYRYLVCGKVLDQLEEFEIQPSHERLCRSLNSVAKTPAQLKLLWSTIISRAGNRPENINSTHVIKTWKELYKDEKYAKICHFEDDIMKKVESSLNKISYEKKNKQLRQESPLKLKQESSLKLKPENIPSVSYIPSPISPETPISAKYDNNMNFLISPVSNNIFNMNYNSNPYLTSTTPSETFNYLKLTKNVSNTQSQPSQPQTQQSIVYYQNIPQQYIYYY